MEWQKPGSQPSAQVPHHTAVPRGVARRTRAGVHSSGLQGLGSDSGPSDHGSPGLLPRACLGGTPSA